MRKEDVLTMDSKTPLDFFPAERRERWHKVNGWLLPDAARRLYETSAGASPEGRIVEIGSYAGKSTCCLGWAQRERVDRRRPPVVAIDIKFQDPFRSNLSAFGLDETIVAAIEAPSLQAAEAWHEPISFLYIDAYHGDAHAVADFVVWEPYVLPGAVIALDDTAGHMSGPMRQVRLALSTGAFERICEVDGISFLKKNRSLFDGLGRFPPELETEKVSMAVVAAWTGAVDPDLWTGQPGTPVAEQQRQKPQLLERLRMRLAGYRPSPTRTYLAAVIDMHGGEWQRAMEKFRELETLPQDSKLLCHDLSIRPFALLRLAQSHDLSGDRDQARSYYQRAQACEEAVPEVRAAAEKGLQESFILPEPRSDLLLRQFVTERQLPQYRTY
jgi:predicted O-methyltransferase YrrM